jgi:hypothetical protein
METNATDPVFRPGVLLIGCGPSGNTIHEIHEGELVVFVRFRVISWIVPVPAGNTKPN